MKPGKRQPAERRPLTSRQSRVARGLAAWLAERGVSPNAISVSSVVFALLAAACFVATRAEAAPDRVLLIAAAFFMQLRLLANLLDGMVAVEWNRASPVGELYNDVPDRIADTLILVGAGHGIGGAAELGYGAAVLAVFVAYVRVIGNHLGARELFLGPMAKPHRMATLTAAAVYGALAPAAWPGSVGAQTPLGAIGVALALIALGCLVTAVRRLRSIGVQLRSAR